MPVTQQDIANHLGISRMSVKRALNGYSKVSEDRRRQILETAQQLGYGAASNAEARALAALRHGRRPRTGTIGCVFLESGEGSTPYFTHLQEGIRRAAYRAGREVLLLHGEPSPGWEKVDGIIGHGEASSAISQRLTVKVPFVSLMTPPNEGAVVMADDGDGVRQAIEHLLSLGHRHIGYLVYEDAGRGAVRVAAYRDALREAGIEPQPMWQRVLWDWGAMDVRGRLSMGEWLKEGFRDTGITALLVQNDRAAIGAMQTLHEAGIRVPQDISVVGFDSTDECELCTPRLTSVRIPLQEIGERAVKLLLNQIEDQENESDVTETTVFPVELQVRDSTARPRV